MSMPSFKSPIEDRVDRFKFSSELKKKILRSERCFIIGLGPSLAKVDEEALKNEFVIGVNYVLKTKFRPDVICISDPGRIDFENLKPGCPKVVTVNHVYRHEPELFDAIDTYHDIDFIDAGSKKRNASNAESFHPTLKNIYWAASVIAELGIPLATYLGMKEIYVLGLDGARASFPSTHAWGTDPHVGGPHASTLFHLHECVSRMAKDLGTSVYNASFGGVVEAFEKINIEGIAPHAIRRQFDQDYDGKIIVWKGNAYRVRRTGEAVRIVDLKGLRYLRHKNGRILLDKDDGTDVFVSDSSWHIEPSFVNATWASFRSVNLEDGYITSWDGCDTYRVRPTKGVFSPYFSSFRLFGSVEDAQGRMDADRMLQSIENQKALLGNMMVRADKS